MTSPPKPFNPGPIAMPSDRAWLDPVLVGRILYTRTTTITAADGNPLLVAPNNINRWAVGFMLQSGGGFNGRIMPSPDVAVGLGFDLVAGELHWFELHKYGSLVMGEWWGVFSPLAVSAVFEVLRR